MLHPAIFLWPSWGLKTRGDPEALLLNISVGCDLLLLLLPCYSHTPHPNHTVFTFRRPLSVSFPVRGVVLGEGKETLGAPGRGPLAGLLRDLQHPDALSCLAACLQHTCRLATHPPLLLREQRWRLCHRTHGGRCPLPRHEG